MPRPKSTKLSKKRPPEPSLPLGPDPAFVVTASRLESHLWEAANILRGPVDAADFKTYLFPLLFFKRICDVWDEETAAAVEEYGDPQVASYPESHRFQIPEGAHWKDVRATAKHVGVALQRALHAIERENPATLHGVFGDAQWTNTERLSDALLKDLLEHFSALPLGNRSVASDLLGDAYEYLIKKFADATNKKAGEFYTPRSVVRLMIDLLDPREGETVYDPACGTGGMLLAAVEHVRAVGGDPRRFFGKLYGQEKNLTTSAIARMNLFLHGVEDFQIVRGDTLAAPGLVEGDRPRRDRAAGALPRLAAEQRGGARGEGVAAEGGVQVQAPPGAGALRPRLRLHPRVLLTEGCPPRRLPCPSLRTSPVVPSRASLKAHAVPPILAGERPRPGFASPRAASHREPPP
jgi:type I restriction enzyme M protein